MSTYLKLKVRERSRELYDWERKYKQGEGRWFAQEEKLASLAAENLVMRGTTAREVERVRALEAVVAIARERARLAVPQWAPALRQALAALDKLEGRK